MTSYDKMSEREQMALIIRDPAAEGDVLSELSPRIWFHHHDGSQIIQLQRNRFLCNWRKTALEHQYPRFKWIKQQFTERLELFERFAEKWFSFTRQYTQFELTYINHILAEDEQFKLADLAQALPDLSWRLTPNRFLPVPEAINLSFIIKMPREAGILLVKILNGRRKNSDNTRAV